MFGHGDGPDTPHLFTHPDAAATADTQIVIALKKGIVSIYRQIPIAIGELLSFEPEVISHPLEFTVSVFRTKHTTLGNGYVAQAYIKWLTTLSTLTSKTGTGMLSQRSLN